MVAPFQGGCMCKAVRYEVTAEPFAVMDWLFAARSGIAGR